MINWISNHLFNAICGVVTAILAYFAEIQGAVHVMWAIMAFDLVTGILSSVIIRKQKFSMSKVFLGIGRAFVASIFVFFLYAMDKEMKQTFAASYNIAGWLVSGFYLWSASENADELFGGRIFGVLKYFFARKVESASGYNLNQTQEQNENKQNFIKECVCIHASPKPAGRIVSIHFTPYYGL
jgi:phage-related holin